MCRRVEKSLISGGKGLMKHIITAYSTNQRSSLERSISLCSKKTAHRYDLIHQALTASAARFLHSSTHRISYLLPHQAQIRPVEMTIAVIPLADTFLVWKLFSHVSRETNGKRLLFCCILYANKSKIPYGERLNGLYWVMKLSLVS